MTDASSAMSTDWVGWIGVLPVSWLMAAITAGAGSVFVFVVKAGGLRKMSRWVQTSRESDRDLALAKFRDGMNRVLAHRPPDRDGLELLIAGMDEWRSEQVRLAGLHQKVRSLNSRLFAVILGSSSLLVADKIFPGATAIRVLSLLEIVLVIFVATSAWPLVKLVIEEGLPGGEKASETTRPSDALGVATGAEPGAEPVTASEPTEAAFLAVGIARSKGSRE